MQNSPKDDPAGDADAGKPDENELYPFPHDPPSEGFTPTPECPYEYLQGSYVDEPKRPPGGWGDVGLGDTDDE
jgi:hypothetical protein